MTELDIIIVFCTTIVNILPAFSPFGTWNVLIFFQTNYPTYSFQYLVFLGIVGSTIGRWLMAKVIYRAVKNFDNKSFNKNIDFFEKISTGSWYFYPLVFSFIYCALPTPTNWLFLPAGKNNRVLTQLLIGHALGRIINYSYSLYFASFWISGILTDPFGFVNLSITAFLVLVLFVDWEEMIMRRRLVWIFSKSKMLY